MLNNTSNRCIIWKFRVGERIDQWDSWPLHQETFLVPHPRTLPTPPLPHFTLKRPISYTPNLSLLAQFLQQIQHSTPIHRYSISPHLIDGQSFGIQERGNLGTPNSTIIYLLHLLPLTLLRRVFTRLQKLDFEAPPRSFELLHLSLPWNPCRHPCYFLSSLQPQRRLLRIPQHPISEHRPGI